MDIPDRRHSIVGFTTSTPIPLKPILRRHSVHNLANVKNVSFDLARNDVFTISPNEKNNASPSDDEHVVGRIRTNTLNRTSGVISCNADLQFDENPIENENAVVQFEQSDSSAEAVDHSVPSPAKEDDDMDLRPARIERNSIGTEGVQR